MLISAAANETHSNSDYKGGGKEIQRQDDKVRQQSAELKAGGDVLVNAGENITLVSSKIGAGDEAYLVAGNKIELLAANDSDYSLYDMKEKGNWGQSKTQRDEVTDIKAVGSEISAGADITLRSGGDQKYQGAKLDSGNDIAIVSGDSVTFEAVKDLHQESHEKSKGDLAWQSAKGKGQTDEALRQSKLLAQGGLTIKAVDGLNIDLKHIDEKTVSQIIDAMVQVDPQLAWLKEAEQRGDVDWRKVQEVHDSWKYSNSGLGAGTQIVIAIVVTYLTAGAASGAIAGAGAGTSMASATAAATTTASAGWLNAAGTAVLSGMASNGAISTINNRGNLSDAFKGVTTTDALRGYIVAGTTAGLTSGLYDKLTSTQTGISPALPNTGAVAPAAGLGTWQGMGQFTANQLLQGGTSALVDRALGGDGKLSDAMRSSLANAFAAAGFNFIGDVTATDQLNWADGSLAKIGLHAVMGGLAAEAAGGDFRTGALAAGLNEALVDSLSTQYVGMEPSQKKGLLVMNSQLIGVLAAAATGGDAKDLQTGSWVAQNSTQYNRQLHPDEVEFASDKDRVKRFATENGLTEEQAERELLRTAAAMVDRGWDSVLTDGKSVRAADYLRAELRQLKEDALFQVSLADYNNERVGLIELFKDKSAFKKVLDDIALVDPLDYRRDAKYMREVLNAKGEGSQEGFVTALEGMINGPSKLALWTMGAANCPSCGANDVANAWNAVFDLPAELRLKAYLDNLHIMQGGGAAVIKSEAASSTELGVGVGITISGGLSGGRVGLGSRERASVKDVAPKNPNSTSALTDAEAGTTGLTKIGSLKGEPELPPKNASPDMVRSIERQNEAAKSLARAGYDVEQLANTGKKGANPDLRINGELADVASPRTGSVGSVLMTIGDKVKKQASSIVINLADSPLTINQVGDALNLKPVEGLKKLYLMKGGEFKVIEVVK